MSREAIPPLDGNLLQKQIQQITLLSVKSLSRPAPRVSRRSKTGVLPGLVPKANPKHGGGYSDDTLIEYRNNSTVKLSLSTQRLSQKAASPLFSSTHHRKSRKRFPLHPTKSINAQTDAAIFIAMKSLSCLAPRVKRSSKTSALLGLLRKLNPKQGSDDQVDEASKHLNSTKKPHPLGCSFAILAPHFF